MSHASHEVPVGGGYASFSCGKYSHISAQAGSAGRCGYYRACFDESLQQTFLHSLKIYLLCAGYHYASDTVGDLSAFHYLSRSLRRSWILPVGAAAYHDLIYLYMSASASSIGPGIVGKMRVGYRRLESGQIDSVLFGIFRIVIGLKGPELSL